MHNSPTPASQGLGWQVWAAMVGVFVGLGVAIYFVAAPPPTQQTNTATKRRDQAGDKREWSTGGFSGRSSRRPNAFRKLIVGQHKGTMPADPMFGTDAGTPEHPPEQPPEKGEPKYKEPAWIKGKVVVMPGSKVLSATFVVRFAKVSDNYWFQRHKDKQVRRVGFPKGSLIREQRFQSPKGHFDLKVEKGHYMVQIKSQGLRDGNPTPTRAVTGSWYRRTYSLLKDGKGAFNGLVLGNGGKPLKGARVAALIAGGSRWGWRIMTMGSSTPSAARMGFSEEDGSFQVTGLPPGRYGIVVSAPGYVAWSQRGISLSDAEHKDLGTIQLDGGTGTIKGKVIGPDAQPKSGAVVVSISMTKRGRVVRFNRSGANGEYLLSEVPKGPVRLFARLGRGFTAPRKLTNLTLKAGETKTHDFLFGQGGLRLKGTVFDADNQPLSGAEVSVIARIGDKKNPELSSGSSTTNEKGEYSISGLQKGLHSVTVKVKGRPSPGGQINITADEMEHNIQLRGGKLRLTFVDKKTQKAPKVPIWGVLTWTSTKPQSLMMKADPGKAILFENLPDNELSLRVFSPGYATLIQKVKAGTPGETQSETITLTPSGSMLLTLKTAQQAPLRDVQVRLSVDGQYKWVPATATAGNEYQVSALPPGPAQLKISAKGYQSIEVNVTVPTKGPGKQTFELTPSK